MRKKIASVILATMLTVLTLAGCGNSSSGSAGDAGSAASNTTEAAESASEQDKVLKDGKKDVITIVFPGNSSQPADLAAVQQELNVIAEDVVDCDIQVQILEWGVFSEQANLMLSSGEDVDILFNWSVQSSALSGQIYDITDLVDSYAPEAKALMNQYIQACYIDGRLYGFPSYHEFANRSGLVCRTDILEELNVDPASITTWDDVDALLAIVHEQYPELYVLVPANTGSGMLDSMNLGVFDLIQNSMVGVYTDGRDGATAHNIYDTDEFREVAERAYAWNKAGYFLPDSTTNTDTRQTYLKAGSCFGYIGTVHPGTKTQESINAGVDVTTIPITHQGSGTSNVATFQYTIPTGSSTPEKALAVLNLMYSNPAFQNLIHYGVEGKDYVVVSDGVAGYPDGVDSSNVGWTNEVWLTGNAPIGLAWQTDPEGIWESYREFNDGANFAPSYGFSFDYSSVKNQVTAVQNVLDKYTALIYSGMSDPAESLDAFYKELDAAGIQDLVDTAQKQLDEWSQAQ